MNGLVLIDKPSGCTSHDVVNRWRRLAGTKRVGHLGTLDPMATGLLAILTGNATRLAQYFGHDEKTYVAEITFGLVSNTYDIEGEVIETGGAAPSAAAMALALDRYRRKFLRTPPAVSAKKINGVPAYKLARQHIAVELAAVEVEIKRLDIIDISGNRLSLVVRCSAGTYIRSLAHDVGRDLGCGAVLSKLRRTAIAGLSVDCAKTLDELAELADLDRLSDAVIPAARLLPEFPSVHFDSSGEVHIRQGRDFRTSPFVVSPGTPFVKALSHAGELIAIGELRIPNIYHPSTVL